MKRFNTLLISILFTGIFSSAQELDAKFSLNTTKIQSIDRQVVVELENAVKQMLNERSWSGAPFGKTERIDCTVGITLSTMPAADSYGAEIHITARRPIYNSVYASPMINYRDGKFDFNYALGQTLDYNEMSLSSNLTAVIAFYVNIIMGLDFDSFSLNGGKAYFTKAMNIANMAQTLGARGWEPFDGKSRYDLALALTEESSKSFHSLWYNYHRLGLDEMAGNASRGRLRIIETLKDLEALQAARPNSILLTLFTETKLDELIKVCGQATAEEKRDIKERLKKIFPAKGKAIDAIK